ncbi:MAG: winged helix-turn-helix domain-containing protein [Thermoproteaceae archaeon]|jgi:DNA-binding transcriptional ArsR family regulator|nr:winged helix-turn-helix domain-containing protein [Thermoproteaceae archaeon]
MIDTVLGSPTRISIILALWRRGEMNLAELARLVNSDQRSVARHLRQLACHGIVETKLVGRTKLYRLSGNPAVRQLAEALAAADRQLSALVRESGLAGGGRQEAARA